MRIIDGTIILNFAPETELLCLLLHKFEYAFKNKKDVLLNWIHLVFGRKNSLNVISTNNFSLQSQITHVHFLRKVMSN
jgi:hypothetical protein